MSRSARKSKIFARENFFRVVCRDRDAVRDHFSLIAATGLQSGFAKHQEISQEVADDRCVTSGEPPRT